MGIGLSRSRLSRGPSPRCARGPLGLLGPELEFDNELSLAPLSSILGATGVVKERDNGRRGGGRSPAPGDVAAEST